MQQRSTVLIVDDSRVMCEFMSLFLSSKYETIPKTDAREALKLIKNGLRPDIILTDLNMPHMHGTEFIEAVRDLLPYVPIMAVSGALESEKRISWLAAGADDFLLKPFHPAEMAVRLSKLIRTKQTVEEPSLGDIFFSKVRGIAAAF